MKNIACNLIYNNGDEGVYVGFNGRCDVKNIIYNVELDADRWCSQPQCSCKGFYDRGFKGNVDEFPCNESRLFDDWTWNPGARFRDDKPFIVPHTGADKIAIMTTRFPNTKERERKIVGFLFISDLIDQHHVIGNKNKSLRLSLDEAQELNFWNYHRNSSDKHPIMWRQGRYRYLEDNQVSASLHDLRSVVHNAQSKSLITRILKEQFTSFSQKRPTVDGGLKDDFKKKVELKRKYGKGGESEPHKKLKSFIAKNPSLIGINKTEVKSFMEHGFESGDRVDILFEHDGSKESMVVEIELDHVMPGIHQAIKYRVLRCSQLGLPISSSKVKASIVAWGFTVDEVKLCKKYGIGYFAHKL